MLATQFPSDREVAGSSPARCEYEVLLRSRARTSRFWRPTSRGRPRSALFCRIRSLSPLRVALRCLPDRAVVARGAAAIGAMRCVDRCPGVHLEPVSDNAQCCVSSGRVARSRTVRGARICCRVEVKKRDSEASPGVRPRACPLPSPFIALVSVVARPRTMAPSHGGMDRVKSHRVGSLRPSSVPAARPSTTFRVAAAAWRHALEAEALQASLADSRVRSQTRSPRRRDDQRSADALAPRERALDMQRQSVQPARWNAAWSSASGHPIAHCRRDCERSQIRDSDSSQTRSRQGRSERSRYDRQTSASTRETPLVRKALVLHAHTTHVDTAALQH